MYQIILASGSPRRKELLTRLGIRYTAIPSAKEELMENVTPAILVQRLSNSKAWDIALQLQVKYGNKLPNTVVIGADTVVAHCGEILGKPKNEEHAKQMLRALQGDSNEVYTGCCLLIHKVGLQKVWEEITFDTVTKVIINEMTEKQIADYVATGEPLDKAGAYAIQGLFAPYVSEIHGDYYNVVGFPIAQIYQRLYAMGVDLLHNND